jgi:hypothetical protein
MQYKKSLMALTLSIAVSASVATNAAETKSVGSGPNPFSDCGIGAALFPTSPVGAVISNIIWDVGTTAVVSATASPETCSGKNMQAAAYILETYDSLVEDTAKGQGDHLEALLSIMEVSESSRLEATSNLRQSIAEVVSSSGYSQSNVATKAEAFYTSMTESLAI